MVENFLTGGEFLGEFMNLEENFFQYFQEDEEHTTFPKLPVPTTSTPFDDFTLHLVEQHREALEETTQNGFRPWKWKSPLSPIPKRMRFNDPYANSLSGVLQLTKQIVDWVNLMFFEQKNAGDPLRNGGQLQKLQRICGIDMDMTLGQTIQAFSKHFLISIILSVLLLQRFYRKCKFYGSCFRIGKRRWSIILVSYLQSLLGYWWHHHLGYVLKNILKL